jgi:hypothetical protein
LSPVHSYEAAAVEVPKAGPGRPSLIGVPPLPRRTASRLSWLPLIACLFIAGCASPLVEYVPITGEDKEGLIKFRFAESMIVFNFGKTSAGIPTEDVTISSVPVPHGQQKFGIAGTGFWQNWGVATLVNVSFRGDSDLIQQLTVSVSDERQQAIQTLGSVAGVIGGLLSIPSTPTQVTLPKGILVTAFLASIPLGCDAKQGRDGWIHCTDLTLDGTKDFTADVTIEPRPIDALPAAVLNKPLYSSNFFYSACRQMTITLKPKADGRLPVSATVAVADPLYVQTLQIPPKGTITVAPSCGANSTSEDPNLPTAIDYLNTLATQAKAMKQSLSGSNSSGASKD